MIFDELIIHNFGIYKGRHEIPLSVKSHKKPIILFGGLNGGGKTTFLDALQLTLYGKFAQCSNRGTMAYHDYLKGTINRNCSTNEGAALELKFSTYIDGELNKYHVKRFWRQTGKSTIREEMEVIHNGELDQVMAEQWYEYVNEFIPLNISGLFFFDGEKIEAIADPEGSARLIQTGISSLLGLDIVDKLENDLDALMRADLKLNSAKVPNEDSPKVQQQESKLSELLSRKESLTQNLASVSTHIDNLKHEIEKLSESYRNAGGNLYDQRNKFSQSLTTINTSISEKEKELQHIAAGTYPLHLVENLLHQAKEQAQREADGKKNQLVLSELENQNDDLILFLKNQKCDGQITKLVKDKLDSHLSKLKQRIPDNTNTFLNIPVEAFYEVSPDSFEPLRKEAKNIVSEISELKDKRINVERELSSVPEEETLAHYQQQLSEHEKNLTREQAKIDILDEQLLITKRQIEQAEIRLINLKVDQRKYCFEAELQNKTLNNVQDVKTILKNFHTRMVGKHINHLESLILESFRALIRKSDLVRQITIDPNTYQILLFDTKFELLPTNRLSAGERQILAISILRGLAKASGRPLPLIIDTPLGRLDSKHRKHLIDNYFPKASHQVILLSTDQEIDRAYRDDLQKYIGREYHIQYEKDLQSSIISEGYF